MLPDKNAIAIVFCAEYTKQNNNSYFPVGFLNVWSREFKILVITLSFLVDEGLPLRSLF